MRRDGSFAVRIGACSSSEAYHCWKSDETARASAFVVDGLWVPVLGGAASERNRNDL